MAAKPPVHAPFDNRIMTMPSMSSNQAANSGGIGTAKYGPLAQPTRGYMVQQQAMPGYSNAGYFNFQYNPSTSEAVYNIQTGGVAESLLYPNALQQPNLAVPLNQSVSWTLLYDRTYELWDVGGYNAQRPGASYAGTAQDPTINGVYADVYQLMWFTGMEMTLDATDAAAVANFLGGTGGGGSGSYPMTVNGGIMMMVPSWVYFGGYTAINSNNAPQYYPGGISYYGYISEWDVTISHWTGSMVPQRCAIDISFQILPPPSASVQQAGNKGITPTFNNPKPTQGVKSNTGSGSTSPTESRF